MKNRCTLVIVHFLMICLMASPTNSIHGVFHETYELAPAPTTPEEEAAIRTRKILIAGGLLAIGAAIGATAAVLCRPGRTGSSGYPGQNGPAGKNGANGMNGLDGFNGPAGSTGTTGPTGSPAPFASDPVNSLTFFFNGLLVNFPNTANYTLTSYVEMPNGSYTLGTPALIIGPTSMSVNLGMVILAPPLVYGSYHPGVLISPASGSLTAADNNSEITTQIEVMDSRSGGTTDLGEMTYQFESFQVIGGSVNNVEVSGVVYTYEATPPLP